MLHSLPLVDTSSPCNSLLSRTAKALPSQFLNMLPDHLRACDTWGVMPRTLRLSMVGVAASFKGGKLVEQRGEGDVAAGAVLGCGYM